MSTLAEWLEALVGASPRDLVLYERALTHPSFSADNYQRLEFLGDRVLGLIMAEWLSELHPNDPEGALSHRFTILVSGRTCAEVARKVGLSTHLRLGKQARDDGGFDRDNIIGDAMEALLGAVWIDLGYDIARALIREQWPLTAGGTDEAVRHPKSLLHEWAEANRRRSPVYSVVNRTGPDHAPQFTVSVSLGSAGEAEAEGSSKQEAETAAAAALLAKLQ